ncbi:MAG: LysM peptidoglycan-binding domain-containing protein [Fibrobacterota bacterium]
MMTRLLMLFMVTLLLHTGTAHGAGWTVISSSAADKRLPSDFVKCLAASPTVIFAATDQGIGFFSPYKDSIGTIDTKSLGKVVINDMKVVGDSLWIASSGGVAAYSLRNGIWALFPPEKSGIRNAARCITSYEHEVWIGTDGGGAYCYNRTTDEWMRISRNSGLLSDNVRAIIAEEDTVWFGTSTQGVSILNRKNNGWSTLDRYDGLSNNTVTQMLADRQRVYIGTSRGLSIFDRSLEDFTIRYREHGMYDDLVTACALDGQYLWIGGMGGITQYDIVIDKMRTFSAADGFPEEFVTSLLVIGDRLYAATDGKGIAVYDKGTPEARIEHVTFHEKTGTITGTALALSAKTDYKLVFYSTGFPQMKFNTGITVKDNTVNHGLLATWDLTGVIDGEYVLELLVKTDRNTANASSISLRTDTFEPEITLNELPLYTNQRLLKIQGAYREKNIANIALYPGPVMASLEPSKREFSGTVELKEGKNFLRAVISDRGGQTSEIKRILYFSDRETVLDVLNVPKSTSQRTVTLAGRWESTVPIKDLSVFPGALAVPFDNATHTFRIDIRLLQEGENLFIFRAVDACGNTSSKKVTIAYSTKGPDIKLHKLQEFVVDSVLALSGILVGNDIKDLSLLPGSMRIPVDTGTHKFSFQRNLKIGKNHWLLVATDNIGNTTQLPLTITRDILKPEFFPLTIPPLVHEPYFTMNGRVDEENLEAVTVEPGGTTAEINPKEGTYSVRVKLNTGENNFTLNARDKAGNVNVLRLKIDAKIDDTDKAVQFMREQMADLERTVDSLRKSGQGGSSAGYILNEIAALKKQVAQLTEEKTALSGQLDTLKKAPPGQLVYFVKKGDTLRKLALRFYGTEGKYLELAQFNRISETQDPKPGDRIVIPVKGDVLIGGAEGAR